jgi:hypothetical protein
MKYCHKTDVRATISSSFQIIVKGAVSWVEVNPIICKSLTV